MRPRPDLPALIREARDKNGRFIKGVRAHPETEFKKGEHWRPHKPYWDKNWLHTEYTVKNRSAKDIADQFEITEGAILFWLRKHGISTRSMKEIRKSKKWGLSGSTNGMFGKNGMENPNWRGGITPDRQSLYSSLEWKRAKRFVYRRDKSRCVRCKKHGGLHIHHVVSFSIEEKRTDPDNLILLCGDCHNWVHSSANINKEYIREEVSG